jgi:hypothetical protein
MNLKHYISLFLLLLTCLCVSAQNFTDNFLNESVDDKPSQWSTVKGTAAIAVLDGKKVLKLNRYSVLRPIVDGEVNNYLSNEFTIEFDAFFHEVPVPTRQYYIIHLWDGTGIYGENGQHADPYMIYRHGIRASGSFGNNTKIPSLEVLEMTWRHIKIEFAQKTLKIFIDNHLVHNQPDLFYDPQMVSFSTRNATGESGGITNISISGLVENIDVTTEEEADDSTIVEQNLKYIFPDHDGEVNQILQTDGNGTLNWVDFTLSNTNNQNSVSTKYIGSLIALDEGKGYGWRLKERSSKHYGDIGSNAVDLSFSSVNSESNGATGNASAAFGENTQAVGAYSFSSGLQSKASGNNAVAQGYKTLATSDFSIAMGSNSSAGGMASTAMGFYTIARGDYSMAFGESTKALAEYSIATGLNSEASGIGAMAMGYHNVALEDYSVAIGYRTTASGVNSTAFGKSTIAFGKNSTAMGIETNASSDAATAMGVKTKASGIASTAMGLSTIARGDYSTALGENTKALASNTFAAGLNSEASGNGAIAIGFNNLAANDNSISIGHETNALGKNSIAMGRHTSAKSYLSFVLGRYNLGGGNPSEWRETDPLFEVGNGSNASNTSNALTIIKNGNIGIGTHLPRVKLHIENGLDATNSTGGYFMIGDKQRENLVFDNNKIIARNNVQPSILYLQNDGGDVYVGRAIVHSSDKRLKQNIENLSYGLYEILQLRPVSYHWKNNPDAENKSLGLIAQDVQPILRELITANTNENTLGVNYTELIPILIKAIQEQQDIINHQGTKIKVLTAELEKKNKASEGFDKRLKQIEKLLETYK